MLYEQSSNSPAYRRKTGKRETQLRLMFQHAERLNQRLSKALSCERLDVALFAPVEIQSKEHAHTHFIATGKHQRRYHLAQEQPKQALRALAGLAEVGQPVSELFNGWHCVFLTGVKFDIEQHSNSLPHCKIRSTVSESSHSGYGQAHLH